MVERVNQILEDMRADGTLTRLSMEWFGEDLTIRQDG
jgi:ABC-type amino acid transport substrate-binding protein